MERKDFEHSLKGKRSKTKQKKNKRKLFKFKNKK